MRILLGARYTVKQIAVGGVQSWIETVKKALEGHNIDTWGRGEAIPSSTYDLGILAHWRDTRGLLKRCERVVTVSHGIIAAEEPGPSARYTSEEVREYWARRGPIVRQPIDLEYWRPARRRRRYLVRFSYRGGLAFVPGLAEELGLEYIHVANKTPAEVREILQQAAVVLATGRAALEAMACGIPTVICDHRAAYQGPLIDTDLKGAMTRNYSGRGGMIARPENVREAVQAALEAGNMRAHVERYHDSRAIAASLL